MSLRIGVLEYTRFVLSRISDSGARHSAIVPRPLHGSYGFPFHALAPGFVAICRLRCDGKGGPSRKTLHKSIPCPNIGHSNLLDTYSVTQDSRVRHWLGSTMFSVIVDEARVFIMKVSPATAC